jgi:hypothetical protein
LGAFCGVPRLQRRQACGAAGIPEPGLGGRLGGGCGRSDGLAGTLRLTMKRRAAGCIEVEQDQWGALGCSEMKTRATIQKASRNFRNSPSYCQRFDLDRSRRNRGGCDKSVHGIAFLSGNQHPEPTSAKQATPLLLFQQSPGHRPESGLTPTLVSTFLFVRFFASWHKAV